MIDRDPRRAAGVLFAIAALTMPAHAGSGAGELSLDRAAVLGLLGAALPGPTRVELPGLPPVTVRVEAPHGLRFEDGGVETRLPVSLDGIGVETAVRVRWVPEVSALDGIVRLRVESAIPEVPLPVDVDLASLLPPAELPRSLDWVVDGPAGHPLRLICVVQGVEVGSDRLVVRFGLVSRVATRAGAVRSP
jgi:hypothetical protein